MSTITAPAVTLSDVLTLSTALIAIGEGRRIEWATEGSDVIFTGTLRHVVDGNHSAMFLRVDADIRTAWVRITMTAGIDTWMPLERLARLMATGWAAVTD